MNDVFKLNSQETLNQKLIQRINKHGFSRIPIFDNDGNCTGILWAKQLLDSSKLADKTIRNSGIRLVCPLIIASNTNLLEALSILEQRKTSIALISDAKESVGRPSRPYSYTSRNDKIMSWQFKAKIVGLICLKDIFEKLVEKEFEDHDQHLQSVLSMTYFNPRIETFKQFSAAPQLVELTEPKEYSGFNSALLDK